MATAQWNITKQMMADIYSGAANPGDSHIVIGPWAANSFVTRAALYAPINFTGMTSINEARLYMAANEPASGFHVKGANEATFYAFRKLTDFSEGSHGDSSGVDELWGGDGDWVVEDNLAEVEGGDLGNWPLMGEGTYGYMIVTQIVRRWFEGHANYGLVVANVTSETQGASSYGKQYYSRHAGGAPPFIWIDYNTNTQPGSPTNLSPTGGVTVHTGTSVTISGSSNDPDPGDYQTGLHIKIFRGAEELLYEHYDYNVQGLGGWSRTLPVPNGHADYYWRARTRDKDAVWGSGIANQYFRANTVPGVPSFNTSETPLSSIKTLTPTFNITRNDADSPYGDYMSSYQIHMYRNGPAGSGTFHWDSGQVGVGVGTVTAQRTYNGPALSWNTSYWVYIRTWDANGAVGGFGNIAFTTYLTPAPVSLDPNASETVGSLTPTLTGARGDGNHTISLYEIELYESNGSTLKWSSGALSAGIINGTSFSKVYNGAALSYSSTYGWRARVTGNIGGTSGWTALQWFNTLAPAAITQTAPLGSPITDLTPDFTGGWSDNFDAVQIIVYETNGQTVKWDSGTLTQTSGTTYSKTYAGAALLWNTNYKWKIRVRRTADQVWQPYTGQASFTTDAAGQPTLTAPINNSWETTLTPTFTGNTAGSETIDVFRILLYESDGQTLTWDSGDLAGSGTSFSKVYNGTNALIAGRSYKWKARYTKTGGAVGEYSALQTFHVNAAPQSPSGITPATGAIVVDTLTPTLSATYQDLDLAAWGDFPVQMEIEVRNNATDALIATQVKTTGLVAGVNSIVWDGTPALAYETTYKWRVRYRDSKDVDGAWSSYNTFKPSESSSVVITAPEGTINSPQVPVAWDFDSPGGKTQGSYRVRVIRNSDEIAVYDSGSVISSLANHTVPAGYLINNTEYTFEVTAVDTDGI